MTEVETELDRLAILLDGKEAIDDQPAINGLVTLSTECSQAITGLQDTLNANWFC